MQIVDLNQTMISNLMVSIAGHTQIQIDPDLLRHMVLNSIRNYNVQFKAKYGEMIIACDDGRSWRKNVFPYYKANRQTDREKSELDWNAVFKALNMIRSELKEYFPYRVIQVPTAEADDIIGHLCREYGNTSEKILIISGDKDFRQLHHYMNVTQYDAVRKRWITENNPVRYLKEHIIRGDRGDGVPNFLSSDDVLVLKGRQKKIIQKKLDQWLDQEPHEFCDEQMLRGWKRNEEMVDLEFTPEHIRNSIMECMESEKGKNKSKLFNFFIEKKLKNLMANINEF